jgi:hypothetical protein
MELSFNNNIYIYNMLINYIIKIMDNRKKNRVKYLNQIKSRIIKELKSNKKKYDNAKKKLFNNKEFNHDLKLFSNIFKLIEK